MKPFFREVQAAFFELVRNFRPLVRYWLETEVHVYGFSFAANALLAFFPFLLVMVALCRDLLGSPAAVEAIYLAIQDYFAGETGDFIVRNLKVSAARRRELEWVSVLLLLFTANGVFLPLEVALNRAWNVTVNRSLLRNQAVSMGLIFSCGALALVSASFTAMNLTMWRGLVGADSAALGWLVLVFFKLASVPITILILFLVYWLLPNTKVPARLILPRAVVVGLFLEALKYVNLLVWPWLYEKFQREYGPFVNSVTILTWSFLAGMVVLAGADWSARSARAAQTGAPDSDRIPVEPVPQP